MHDLTNADISVGRILVNGPKTHSISIVCGDTDLIVIINCGRSGMARRMIDSLAEYLIREALDLVMPVPARNERHRVNAT